MDSHGRVNEACALQEQGALCDLDIFHLLNAAETPMSWRGIRVGPEDRYLAR